MLYTKTHEVLKVGAASEDMTGGDLVGIVQNVLRRSAGGWGEKCR